MNLKHIFDKEMAIVKGNMKKKINKKIQFMKKPVLFQFHSPPIFKICKSDEQTVPFSDCFQRF